MTGSSNPAFFKEQTCNLACQENLKKQKTKWIIDIYSALAESELLYIGCFFGGGYDMKIHVLL